jgi:hypothetical protein
MNKLSDYVLVKREPDEAMSKTGAPHCCNNSFTADMTYRAMTAASPPLVISEAEIRAWFEEPCWQPSFEYLIQKNGRDEYKNTTTQQCYVSFRTAFKLMEQAGWLTIREEK